MIKKLSQVQLPHVFILLTTVIFICSLLSYIIPSGEFQKEKREIDGISKTLIIPGTFSLIERHYSIEGIFFNQEATTKSTPVSLLEFLSAIPRGMEAAADIIFFIFIIGGVFGILQRTGTIIAFLQKLLSVFNDRPNILIIILMVAVGIASSTLGMGEELIPLVPLFLIVSKNLGYDRIMGVAIVWLASEIGFAAATTNPYTVQIAQNLAEVPLNSGIIFRVVFFIITMSAGIMYLIRYGKRIKLDPTNSFMADDDFITEDLSFEEIKFNKKHMLIIISGILLFSFII